MELRLFGLVFPVHGQIIESANGAQDLGFAGAYDARNGYVEMRGMFFLPASNLTVEIDDLLLRVREVGTQLVVNQPTEQTLKLRLREGQHNSGSDPARVYGLLFEFACFRIARRRSKPIGGNEYTFHFFSDGSTGIELLPSSDEVDGTYAFIGAGNLPFHILPARRVPWGGNPFLRVDLGQGLLKAEAGLLRLDSYNANQGVTGFSRCFFSSNPQSRAFVLRSGQSSLDLAFQLGTLPLHAYADSSNAKLVQASVLAQGGSMVLRFEHSPLAQPWITSISLQPPSAPTQPPLELHLHNIADRANRHLRLRARQRVDLAVRLANGDRPSSFMIASAASLQAVDSPSALHDHSSPAEFDPPTATSALRIEVDQMAVHARDPLLAPALSGFALAPRLHWLGGKLRRPQPGRRLASANGTDVEMLGFPLPETCMPMLSADALRGDPTLHQAHLQRINSYLACSSDAIAPMRHESALQQQVTSKDQNIGLQALYALNSTAALSATAATGPILGAHTLRRDFGVCVLEHEVAAGAAIDHVLLDPSLGGWEIKSTSPLDICPRSAGVRGFFQVDLKSGPATRFWGVLKLSREQTLEQVLASYGRRIDLDQLDEALRRRDWTGLILFDLRMAIDGFPLLADLGAGMNELELNHLALTPERAGGGPGISAELEWSNPALPPDISADQEQEAGLSLRSLSLRVRDGRLAAFRAVASLDIYGLFGHRHTAMPRISIEGSYDADAKRIRFLGQAEQGIALFPPDAAGAGPLKQVTLRGVEAVREGQDTILEVDGDVELKEVNVLGWKLADAEQKGRFRRLGFLLDSTSGWLRVLYRRLRFEFARPPLNLLGSSVFALQLDGIEFDWKAWQGFRRMVPIHGDLRNRPALALRFGLRLGRLPELFSGSVDGLEFELGLALPIGEPWDLSRLSLAIGIRGFDGLDIELLRFLRLKADTMRVDSLNVDGREVPMLRLEALAVEILGKELLANLDLLLIANPFTGEPGVLLRYGADSAIGTSLFHVSWFLIGRHIQLPTDVARSLIAIDPPDSIGLGNQSSLLRSNSPEEFVPRVRAQGAEQWVFGLGISVLGNFLIGKALFHDRRYYGLALQGEAFKEWFGFDFAISVLYVRRHRPEEDSLIASVRVPAVTIGPVHFQGGVVTLEVQMGGGFLLDMGFPRLLANGRRDWSRVFGAILTPLQASGGMYIGLRALTPASGNDTDQIVEAGYAIQGGLGAAWGGGVFRVWGTVGVYAILEGRFTLRDKKLVQIEIVGAVGILVRGVGELNWWIISIRIEVIAAAEARATILWRQNQKLNLRLDFVLYASASAQACIGSGFFKICRGISVGIDLPYSLTLDIG